MEPFQSLVGPVRGRIAPAPRTAAVHVRSRLLAAGLSLGILGTMTSCADRAPEFAPRATPVGPMTDTPEEGTPATRMGPIISQPTYRPVRNYPSDTRYFGY